ncbi:hypothetical protein AVEN_201874-1 [Araneus ventricosus]|uniref:Uncharacterized protein n=1 Tax=Araneus ventricosus TaxID=182803 RepID=A0A4Y2IY56_ARAVE|nr:hypothetical protein AVEN_201874-1 [Araneus ventricosus]
MASQFIRWHFIPPYSPHFGGIWEATVKQRKNYFLRACRADVLNFEELSTLLCQVEACPYSRPLVPFSSDPSDVRALSPGHFLIGSPLLEILDSDHEGDLVLTSRSYLFQSIRQNFWKDRKKYLHHLQRQSRWTCDFPTRKESSTFHFNLKPQATTPGGH